MVSLGLYSFLQLQFVLCILNIKPQYNIYCLRLSHHIVTMEPMVANFLESHRGDYDVLDSFFLEYELSTYTLTKPPLPNDLHVLRVLIKIIKHDYLAARALLDRLSASSKDNKNHKKQYLATLLQHEKQLKFKELVELSKQALNILGQQEYAPDLVPDLLSSSIEQHVMHKMANLYDCYHISQLREILGGCSAQHVKDLAIAELFDSDEEWVYFKMQKRKTSQQQQRELEKKLEELTRMCYALEEYK